MISCAEAATSSRSDCPSSDSTRQMAPSAESQQPDIARSSPVGQLKELKNLEAELKRQLDEVRQKKRSAIQSRPLTIGVIGFGRFGQFIASTFRKYGRIVVTSRSDYTDIANTLGVKYVPLSDPQAFLNEGLDVIVVAVSIMSFERTILNLVPHLQSYIDRQKLVQQGIPTAAVVRGPLVVDVLSVKEHARNVMLQHLPVECDILCTHPMFGPDSGRHGWTGLPFVYERTRVDQIVLEDEKDANVDDDISAELFDNRSVEGMDRVERFLSIWEEEGCAMIPMSCWKHDAYAANSQFITHLMGRILGAQGLVETPIDTKGFQSVLKLVEGTTADSFDLFYGLYKYNKNSLETIVKLRSAMDDVVDGLTTMDKKQQQSKL